MPRWILNTPVVAEWTSKAGDVYRIHSAPVIATMGSGIKGNPLWTAFLFLTRNNERFDQETYHTFDEAIIALRKISPDVPDMSNNSTRWRNDGT